MSEAPRSAKEQATSRELAHAHVVLAKRAAFALLTALPVTAAVLGVLWWRGAIRFSWEVDALLAEREHAAERRGFERRVGAPPAPRPAVPLASVWASAHASATSIAVESIPDAHARFVFARFDEERLAECIELETRGSADAATKVVELGESAITKEKGKAIRITKSCAESFSDRVELASCAFEIEKDGAAITMRSHLYDFDLAFGSDVNMHDCMKMKGEWKAISRTSREYDRAKLDAAGARLRDMVH